MIIGTCRINMHAGWVHSLKEKRTIVKSIIDKVKHKFNVSISELDALDLHQTVVLGIACVTNDTKHANSILQNVINFIEQDSAAVIADIKIEIL